MASHGWPCGLGQEVSYNKRYVDHGPPWLANVFWAGQTNGPNPWSAMAGHGVWARKFHRITGLMAMARYGWPLVLTWSDQCPKPPWPAMAGHGAWAQKFHRPTDMMATTRHAWPMVFGTVRPMSHTSWPSVAGHRVWEMKFHMTTGMLGCLRWAMAARTRCKR